MHVQHDWDRLVRARKRYRMGICKYEHHTLDDAWEKRKTGVFCLFSGVYPRGNYI
jgi:hypothetical protein